MKKSAYLASTSPQKPLKRHKINILGVEVDDVSEKEAVDDIIGLARDKMGHNFVATVNSEFIMLAKKDQNFKNILDSTNLNLPDSTGVVVSKLILGGKVQNRVTGTDLIEKLCQKCADFPITVGFLGGFGNVAETAKQRQMAKYPGLKVAFAASGDPTISYDLRLKKAISAAGRVDILFVAFGMGSQEFWIMRNKGALNVGVFIGVGGGIDYISGHKTRSPGFLQKMGLEWLWRLFQEPQRIGRMAVLPVFAILVFWQFLSQKFGFSENLK
ncbi:WecB/TagA/CpsF family glycosyltransferase [Candidatus Curtissbacteria bacterium]|nr:WecB/TagA/CpsF family glycosyltransferase [Candidatus Curtissbacteria bacterium]